MYKKYYFKERGAGLVASVIVDNHKLVYQTLREKKSWDYIDPMGLTSAYIEKFYQSMKLDVMGKVKDDYIENKLHIAPSMVGYFYYFLHVYRRIPTQAEYIKFYCVANKSWVLKNVSEKGKMEAFIGRLSRFYPSMLRDIHFYHVLKESEEFEKVLFTLKYDLESKVDIFVKKKSRWFGIQLRTMTRRSNEFYEKKKNRNAVPTSATLIDMPIDLSKAKSIHTKKDAIKLYSNYHVEQLLQNIHNQNIHMVSNV